MADSPLPARLIELGDRFGIFRCPICAATIETIGMESAQATCNGASIGDADELNDGTGTHRIAPMTRLSVEVIGV